METTFRLVDHVVSGSRLYGMEIGEGRDVAIHFHGTWDNFYGYPFIARLAPVYNSAGMRYASVNLPSHDGWSIDEQLERSLEAISEWIEYLRVAGSRVILQGHSLGALKTISWLMQEGRDYTHVQGVVLLAPFDIVAFYGGSSDVELERKRSRAQQVAETEGKAAILPSDVFDLWRLSVGTFLEMTRAGGPWDLFPVRDENRRLPWIDEPPVPTMIAFGSDDFAALPSIEAVDQRLAKTGSSTAIIAGAPHDYSGAEEELTRAVRSFVEQLSGR